MFNCLTISPSGSKGKGSVKLLMYLFVIFMSLHRMIMKNQQLTPSLSLNLSSTSEVKTTMTKNEKGEQVKEKSYVKERQVEQVVKKFCSWTVEIDIKWKRNLDHVIKLKPCTSPKAKLDMAEAMLYGNLLESWKLWRKTKEAVEVEKKFMGKDTGTKYMKLVPRVGRAKIFKACLGRLRNKFLKKYDTRK